MLDQTGAISTRVDKSHADITSLIFVPIFFSNSRMVITTVKY